MRLFVVFLLLLLVAVATSSDLPCGNGICNSGIYGEDSCNCPEDCPGPCCGDGTCEAPDEHCDNCPKDCGVCPSQCNNGECEDGEDCASCPEDCGGCPTFCGDGVCDDDEDCNRCSDDCGSCTDELGFLGAILWVVNEILCFVSMEMVCLN